MKQKLKPAAGSDDIFFNRDISWLSFNERVLSEAQRDTAPLMERIKFLAIYSSNLDEFYRVRMLALMALNGIANETGTEFTKLLPTISDKILQQQKYFGGIIEHQILPELKRHGIHLVYNEPLPETIIESLKNYFIHTVASFIHVTNVSKHSQFFPENNKLYFAVTTISNKKGKQFYIVNIPSDTVPRFYSILQNGIQYIVFLDDIVKLNLHKIFADQKIRGCHSFKITRDAELDLEDEFTGNLAKKIEKKISQRDRGLATRFLYEPGISTETLELMKHELNLKGANFIQGGTYHNLKDLANLPLKDLKFHYETWPPINFKVTHDSLFQEIKKRDILLHPPYHTYETVLRFFNEAAIDPSVEVIYVTLYRVANDSRIVNALISASKNGKKVIVFVELKARFDEANNIKWSKKMKASGVQIIESIPALKVHAKLALIKRRNGKKTDLLGLFATGNFNESTARFYTDHILMTSHSTMLKEAEKLFRVLKKRKKNIIQDKLVFKHLLVGQFNLQQRFIHLIEREILNSKKGLAASITIKFNNLEDAVLISKLYEASNAGVKISLIVRSICCLIPGIKGMSKNITVMRIIDRYLEHGRVFIFHNNNDPEVYLGSADWMNRNIYRRIEVCFPLYDAKLKSELISMVNIQLRDNSQAVTIDAQCNNVPIDVVENLNTPIRSQKAIGKMLVNAY